MTSHISTHPPTNKDVTIGSTFRQEYIQVSTPIPGYERYVRQDKPHRLVHMIKMWELELLLPNPNYHVSQGTLLVITEEKIMKCMKISE